MNFFDWGMKSGFIPYTAETENIINDIVDHYNRTGETSFDITYNDAFDYDWDYIKSEVERRIK